MSLSQQYPEKIDLLISDMIMPVMNGRELAIKIQAIRPELKVLFMSGYTAEIISKQGIVEEGIHFLQKPVSREILTKKVREILDQIWWSEWKERIQDLSFPQHLVKVLFALVSDRENWAILLSFQKDQIGQLLYTISLQLPVHFEHLRTLEEIATGARTSTRNTSNFYLV